MEGNKFKKTAPFAIEKWNNAEIQQSEFKI
jgi:hypothetical protein